MATVQSAESGSFDGAGPGPLDRRGSGASSTPHGRPTHVRYAVLIFLGVLAFLSYFDRVCITRAQADIQRDTGISDAEMGKVFGAFWLAYAIFDIPGGWLGDRFGARKTLTRIVMAWSIFTALTGSAVSFVSLYAYRFAFGAGEAGAFPNTARVQSRWIPAQHQGRISGIIWLVARWAAHCRRCCSASCCGGWIRGHFAGS